jgi:hypothetical protein
MEPEFHYRVQKGPPTPEPSVTFRNELNFYGEKSLAPRPTPKLEAWYQQKNYKQIVTVHEPG